MRLMAIVDFGVDRGEALIPRIRHEVTRPLAEALLAKFPKAVLGLWDYDWQCGISLAKDVDGIQCRQGWYLCGHHPDGETYAFGMPDYDDFVNVIERWLAQ